MKIKIIVFIFFIVLIINNSIYNNPILLPQALIAEFMFEDEDSWVLEITFNSGIRNIHNDFDSLCVETSSGKSRVIIKNIRDNPFLIVIKPDSLVEPLSINKFGDCIKLYSYVSQDNYKMVLIDSMIYGNYPGSTIDSLPSGYSIASILIPDYFVKDKSPSIGFENDTSGTSGLLTGYMYDKRNYLITKGNFTIENPLIFQSNGKYLTSIYSNKTVIYGMQNNYTPYSQQGFRIDTMKINMNPWEIIEKDIHVKDELVYVSERESCPDYEINIINYPNPFNSSTNFFIKIPDKLKDKRGEIEIYNINGQLIRTIPIKGSGTVHWDGKNMNGSTMPSGIYYYRLNIDDQVMKNGSMILLK